MNYPHASIKLMKTKSNNYFLLDGGGMSSEEISFINEKNKKDGKKTSLFEKELKTYLGKYASMLHK